MSPGALEATHDVYSNGAAGEDHCEEQRHGGGKQCTRNLAKET
jgi:hypothetical protein